MAKSIPTWVNEWAALGTVSSAFSIYDWLAQTLLETEIKSGQVQARFIGKTENKAIQWKNIATKNEAEGSDPVCSLPLRDMEVNRASLVGWMKQNEPVTPKGAKRGRKASYDWEECLLFMFKYSKDHELPKKQDGMVATVEKWFRDNYNATPHISENKKTGLSFLQSYFARWKLVSIFYQPLSPSVAALVDVI